MGPIATAYFYQLVIQMTQAEVDQEHIEMLIYSKPSIPDRTDYILGRSKANPVHPMVEIGRKLVEMGAENIVIPCVTAHYFHEILSEGISVPIIHAVKETAMYLKERGIRCAGIMATEGTVQSGLFQAKLEECGISPVIPDAVHQQAVTDLIYKNVKANKPIDYAKFCRVSRQLRQEGAQAIILGCTELSLIKRDYALEPGYLDAMEIMAMRSVIESGAGLKEEYADLITR